MRIQWKRLKNTLIAADSPVGEPSPGSVPAAVLIPLFETGGEDQSQGTAEGMILFTERRDTLARHPGEISFPGGRTEDGDGTLLATALRETREEIGLPEERVTVLGRLPPVSTVVTGYCVHPFVGEIRPLRPWPTQSDEVERVIEIPVGALSEGPSRLTITRYGVAFDTDAYCVQGSVIWGATARIVESLFEYL